ncbi:MAG: HD domain-containing protein, partial [Spirochaetales bacterium]
MEIERAQQILRIDSELNKIRDYDLLLDRVLLEARRVVNADAGSIYVKENDVISIKFAHNDTKQKLLPRGEKQAYPHFSIPVNMQTISGYVAMTGELVNIKDVYRIRKSAPYSYNTEYDEKSGYKTTSMLTVPLKTQNNKILGVIQIINALDVDGSVRAFSANDEVLVTHFASNATVVLQNAYMTRSMIMRMIRMAEMRDPKETNAHVNRVASYSVEMYERWAYKRGLDQKTIDKEKDIFKLAAMLHDVGKVAISDLILKKPARFTPEEYVIMQTHACAGARLFDDPLSDFDTVAAEVALTHHENWDGTGYPGWIDPATREPLRTDENGRA